MASGPVTVRCPSCSLSWEVQPKPDGTRPKTTRCAQYRGGCGRVVKVPQQAAGVPMAAGPAAAVAAAWDPPSQSRLARWVAEQCPQCGAGKLAASPRGTVRECESCGFVTPRGVTAPYERGTGSTREARSQRERDDDAKKTVILAGEFLRRVRELADDPRIHPASGDLLGWYEEEIGKAKTARNAARLAELAAEFDADRKAGAIRRHHWWQGQPAAITTGDDDEDDDFADEEDDDFADDDEDGEFDEDDAQGTAVVLAAPASVAEQQHRAQPQEMTWVEALAVNGLRMMPLPEWDGCQIVNQSGNRCGSPETTHHVGPPNQMGGWACSPHYYLLTQTIAETNRARGI